VTFRTLDCETRQQEKPSLRPKPLDDRNFQKKILMSRKTALKASPESKDGSQSITNNQPTLFFSSALLNGLPALGSLEAIFC
jgi:hypothetical protein